MKTKTQPLINEIFLKGVEEFVEDHFPDLSPFEDYGNSEQEEGHTKELLVEIVKKIFELNDPNIRFAAFEAESEPSWGEIGSWVKILNADVDATIDFSSIDDEDDPNQCFRAREAAKILNDFVERFFAQKRKSPKAKITQKEFVAKKGAVCPFCLSDATLVTLGPVTKVYGESKARIQNMGCRKCGETWSEKTTMQPKLSGFGDFL